MRIPTRIKHAPQLMTQVIQRQASIWKGRSQARNFHLCYFSCRSYYRYLYCALHSVKHSLQDVSLTVHIFNDADQPLTANQIASIQTLLPGTRVVTWPRCPGWGSEQIGHIWRAFALAARDADPHDFIARVDSDVFFFNDRIFRAVSGADVELVGDGHYDNFRFCQGGCYFFRVDAVQKITQAIAQRGLDDLLKGMETVSDDRATAVLAREVGLRTWMTWFMMFPTEYKNAGGLNAWSRFKFSCFHSINKDKSMMLQLYDKEVLGGHPPRAYELALAVE